MYAKLYSSIVMSSIWSEDLELRVLWITLLAIADREGFVFGSPSGLATFARLPIAAVVAGLEKFKGPDEYSTDLKRSPENQGRRIEEVDGGWKIINYEFYRSLQRAEDRKAQYRESKRRQRGQSTKVSPSPECLPSEAEAEAEADTEAEAVDKYIAAAPGARRAPPKRFQEPTVEEVAAFIEAKGYETDPLKFIAHYKSNGWMVGKNRMKNWKAAVVTWERSRDA